MAESISLLVGRLISLSSAVALMIWPDWQYPHCGTSWTIQAFLTASASRLVSPSMVVISLAPTSEMDIEQERMGCPSKKTVQAPHCASPHPNLTQVMRRLSRRTQ